jgi:hypothetical protein
MTDLTDDERDEVIYAVRRRIDFLRDTVRSYAYTIRPDLAEQAHLHALWLAHAEHAYRKLGGTNNGYLPACYRDPELDHKAQP